MFMAAGRAPAFPLHLQPFYIPFAIEMSMAAGRAPAFLLYFLEKDRAGKKMSPDGGRAFSLSFQTGTFCTICLFREEQETQGRFGGASYVSFSMSPVGKQFFSSPRPFAPPVFYLHILSRLPFSYPRILSRFSHKPTILPIT